MTVQRERSPRACAAPALLLAALAFQFLINAVNEVAREQAQSFLRETHQKKILKTYQDFESVDGFSTVATLEQVAAQNYSLALPLYVKGATMVSEGEQLSVDDALSYWREAARASEEALQDVLKLLREEVNAWA